MPNEYEPANRIGDEQCSTPLLDILPDPAATIKPDGTIAYWNPSAERTYGYVADDIAGRNIRMLFPKSHIAEWHGIEERLQRGERIERHETLHVTKTGDMIEVSLSGAAMRGPDGEMLGVVLFLRDLTEKHRSERAMALLQQNSSNRLVVLDAASRVALDILASRTGVEALRHIADAARTLAGARYAALGVAGPDGASLIEFVTVGLTPDEESKIGARPKGVGILGLLLSRSEPLRIGVLQQNPSSSGFPSNHPPMDSFLGVPIRRGDTILGSLYLTNKVGAPEFTEQDEIAVAALGAHAAVAIHNLQMLSRQRALLAGLINAQEEERRAIAYDLHDGLTQFVMASHMHMEAFRKAHAAGNSEKADRDLLKAMQYLKEAVVESRRLVNGLRSLALDDLGLAGAIEQLFADEKSRAGWTDAELAHNITDRRFDKSLETAVYRVVQEALTNVRKHATADKVRVLILLSPDAAPGQRHISVEVRDWGRGFVPEEKASDSTHVGLQGMAERVSLAGGTYALLSAPNAGSIVRATLPLIEVR